MVLVLDKYTKYIFWDSKMSTYLYQFNMFISNKYACYKRRLQDVSE